MAELDRETVVRELVVKTLFAGRVKHEGGGER